MNATSSNGAVEKLVKIWEHKNAKRALRGAGLSTLALSLAACGSSSDSNIDDDNVISVNPIASDLTAHSDDVNGGGGDDTIEAGLVYNPGGTDRVNSLQSEDIVDGGNGTDTINIVLGHNNDNGGTEIAPTFLSVEIVNVQFTSTAGNAEGGYVNELNLEFSEGVDAVNVTRLVGDNTTDYSVIGMEGSTDELSVSGVTNDAGLEFNYREGILEGMEADADTLALDISSAAMTSLEVNQGNRLDGAEDEEFSFEQVDITTGGRYANVDDFIFDVDGDDSDWDALSQDATLTLGVDTEFNAFTMPAADSLAISLGSNDLQMTADETDNDDGNTDANGDAVFGLDDARDGMSVGNLNSLTITGSGDALLNGIDGEVVAVEFDDAASRETADSLAERYTQNDTGLTIDASAMTGRLLANISSGVASDDDSSLVSGSGDDYIDYMGALNHSANTGAGNDYVEASDMLGLGDIETGAGDDVVDAGDMGAFGDSIAAEENAGRDSAASISTGTGDDTVTVGTMANAAQWDDNVLDDANVDDHWVTIGASVETGSGDDTVNSSTMAEQTLVSTSDGDDTVNLVSDEPYLHSYTHMLADTDDSREVVAVDETVTNETTVEDFTGANVLTGAGADTINFTDYEDLLSTTANGSTIVQAGAAANVGTGEDRGGAHIDAGEGADVLNVNAYDIVFVSDLATANGNIGALVASAYDVEELVYGVETLNLTTLNEIGSTEAAASGLAQNDADLSEGDATIHADIERFDSALATINLVADSDALLDSPEAGAEDYLAGEAGTFRLYNLRDQEVTLSAREATGVTAGELVDDLDADVNLTVDMLDAEGFDTTFTLEIAGNTDGNAGADFDLSFTAAQTRSDQSLDATSATDDDAGNIEHVVFNITDGSSHGFDMNSFGDLANTADATDAILSGTADTSMTVTGSAAGETVTITEVHSKVITANIAADVNLTVDAENHYTIVTGSGDDTIDMTASNVRADSSATAAVDEYDRINAGAGEDTMIVDGSDSLGSTAAATTNDDDWENIEGVEHLIVNVGTTAAADSHEIVLDEDAEASGLETITAREDAGAAAYTLALTIGDDFDSTNHVYTAGDALIVDLSALDAGLTTLTLDNQDDDTDVDVVNLDIHLNATNGVEYAVTDFGDDDNLNRTYVTVSSTAATVIDSTATTADGEVEVVVTAGSMDELYVIDQAETVTPLVEDLGLTVTVDDGWNTEVGGTLLVDATDIEDVDADTTTGGATLDGSAETSAVLTIYGTQNDDIITGGAKGDSLYGNGGDDDISGGAGDDTIDGGTGDDVLEGGDGDDTIDGGAGDDEIVGGAGQNTLTGGAGDDQFIWANVAHTTFTDIDTVTDFTTGEDTMIFTVDIGATATIVDVGSFASGTVGEGSLSGNAGDAYWNAEDGVLHIDVNGDGDITDGADYQVSVADTVARGDVVLRVQNFTTGTDELDVTDATQTLGNVTLNTTLLADLGALITAANAAMDGTDVDVYIGAVAATEAYVLVDSNESGSFDAGDVVTILEGIDVTAAVAEIAIADII